MYDPDQTGFLFKADLIFIVYNSTLKNFNYAIEILCQTKVRKCKIYFIRSFCDNWKPSNSKSIDE